MQTQLTKNNKKSNLSPAAEQSVFRKTEEGTLLTEQPQTDAALQMKSNFIASNGGTPPGSGDGDNNLNNSRLFDYLKVQPKLTIGSPNDKYEQEANRVADQVMRMPEDARPGWRMLANDTVQRSCSSCGEEENSLQTKPLYTQISPLIQRQPIEEEEEMMQTKPLLQRQPTEEEEEELQPKKIQKKGGSELAEASPDTESKISQSRGSGQPLQEDTRSFMESRFGAGFNGVNIHTDSNAVQMNRDIQARAFTLGSNIYFNLNQYNPNSSHGKRLLAHELTHVVQQNSVLNRVQIQRLCGPEQIGTELSCTRMGGDAFGETFLFNENCDEFAPNQEERLREFAAAHGAGTDVIIHGFASEDGPEDYNEELSCARAEKAGAILNSLGLNVVQLYNHGEVPGDLAERRSVVIQIEHGNMPAPQEQTEPTNTIPPHRQEAEARARTDRTLEFIKIKMNGRGIDHWWIEIDRSESYGWWPSGDASDVDYSDYIDGSLTGILNATNRTDNPGTPTRDPYHGEGAITTFHPVMDDFSLMQGFNRDRVMSDDEIRLAIRDYAVNFAGDYNLLSGPSCHTFISDLMRRLHLVMPSGSLPFPDHNEILGDSNYYIASLIRGGTFASTLEQLMDVLLTTDTGRRIK